LQTSALAIGATQAHALVVWRRIGSSKGGSQSLGSRLTGPVEEREFSCHTVHRQSTCSSMRDFQTSNRRMILHHELLQSPRCGGGPAPRGWPPPPTMDRRGAFFIYCSDPEIFLTQKSRGDRPGCCPGQFGTKSRSWWRSTSLIETGVARSGRRLRRIWTSPLCCARLSEKG
jgi:hypothetical protein